MSVFRIVFALSKIIIGLIYFKTDHSLYLSLRISYSPLVNPASLVICFNPVHLSFWR